MYLHYEPNFRGELYMQWVYHNPVFDVDYVHPSIRLSSAWVGHNHFAYDFIRFMKPKKVVELGTHYGSSFLQLLPRNKR